jgi:hypothetical protein
MSSDYIRFISRCSGITDEWCSPRHDGKSGASRLTHRLESLNLVAGVEGKSLLDLNVGVHES